MIYAILFDYFNFNFPLNLSSVLVTFVDHFNQIVNTLSEKLRAKANGKTVVGLMEELNRATLDAIAIVSCQNQLYK